MLVIRASTAGFCMGVDLALKKLENALAMFSGNGKISGRICTLGPIIHNPQALAHFGRMGVVCIDNANFAEKDDYALIRAHGIPLAEEAELRRKCARVEDATCPKVKKAQLAIARATREGARLLLFGEGDHPEVRGLVSYAKDRADVFGSISDLESIDMDSGEACVLASQTTQDREIFATIVGKLKRELKKLTVLSTICDATRQRQQEAGRIASQVDAMVVIGGRESGNTRRLASLARQTGIETFHVEEIEELSPLMFAGKSRIGLTAGASTPKNLIDAAESWLLAL